MSSLIQQTAGNFNANEPVNGSWIQALYNATVGGVIGAQGATGATGPAGPIGATGPSEIIFGATFDGGGSDISTTSQTFIYVPFDCTVNSWFILGEESGATPPSIVIDVRRGFNVLPNNATYSIAGSEKPTLSTQNINTDLSLSTWTTSLVSGDIIGFYVDSQSGCKRATVQIKVNKI